MLDTLIHLGAGCCSELEEHLALEPRILLLAEADPELAEKLESRVANLTSVIVKCVAVSGHPGKRTFYRYNLPDARSLHPATGLSTLFPGLRLLETFPINTVHPAALIQDLEIRPQNDNLLFIDVPGEELSILSALQQTEYLHLFFQIRIRCGLASLYEGSPPASEILVWLRENGFDVFAEDDSSDPARPCWTLRRTPLLLSKHELNGRVQKLTSELDEQKALRGSQQATISHLKQQLSEQNELTDNLKEQNQLLSSENKKHIELAGTRTLEISRLSDERERLAKLAADQTKTIERLEMKNEELATSLANKQEKNDLVAKELEEKKRLLDQYLAELDKKTQLHKEGAEQIKDRDNEIQALKAVQGEQLQLLQANKTEISRLNAALDQEQALTKRLELRIADLERNKQTIDDEIHKAEAQVELIKDLLLREPSQ